MKRNLLIFALFERYAGQLSLSHLCLCVTQVLEETGYNLAGQLNPEDVFEISIKEQKISLFVVPGVPEDFPFKTKTRKEISVILTSIFNVTY